MTSNYDLFDKRIIVGGLPRSGSTLLRFILDASNEIISGPETAFFTRPLFETQNRKIKLYDNISEKLGVSKDTFFKSIMNTDSISAFDSLMDDYRKRSGHDNKRIWAEKTPNNIFHYYRLATESKDDIKFISTVRNGLDVVTSEYPKSDPRYKERRYWVSVQQYIDCMRSMYSFDSSNHYIFNYEEFCKNPVIEGERIFNFLGVQFDSKILREFNVQDSITRDMSKVIQPKLSAPISSEWIGRWKDIAHAEKIEEFRSSEEAMQYLEKSGYIPD